MEVFLQVHTYPIVSLGEERDKYLTQEPHLLVGEILMQEVWQLILLNPFFSSTTMT